MRIMLVLFTLFFVSASAEEKCERKPGDPLEHLPANIEILTHFGERADISPDNQRVAFMAKSFGDAMLIDLKSRVITCLTCNLPPARHSTLSCAPGRSLPPRDALGVGRLHLDRSRSFRGHPH